MKTSSRGIELIKEHETFKSAPYLDPIGIPTIGYGTTRYPGGKKVTMQDEPIDESTARHLLVLHLRGVEQQIGNLVEVELNQHQFDALASFVYNLGPGNLERSTLLKKINANPGDTAIYDEFLRWVHADGTVLPGLVKRRTQEANLYFANT